MATCRRCPHIEPPPADIARVMGEVYYCPIHGVYVRPDDCACSHIDRDGPEPAADPETEADDE